MPVSMNVRSDIRAEDIQLVRRLTAECGYFSEAEVDVAVELIEEACKRGEKASGYHFLFVDPLAYACYGPIACTRASYDLYWIVTGIEYQNRGIGGNLLAEVEQQIAKLGGQRIYIETSGSDLYAPTREFYQRRGYSLAAEFPGFYDEGDDKLVYVKLL